MQKQSGDRGDRRAGQDTARLYVLPSKPRRMSQGLPQRRYCWRSPKRHEINRKSANRFAVLSRPYVVSATSPAVSRVRESQSYREINNGGADRDDDQRQASIDNVAAGGMRDV